MAMSGGKDDGSPMMEMNTTPLIDVMLVLLIMFIITIPVATHSVNVNLPAATPPTNNPIINPVKNKLMLTPTNQILWNGSPITEGNLVSLLQATKAMAVEPELQFQPDGLASYEIANEILKIITESKVTKFGFGQRKLRDLRKGSLIAVVLPRLPSRMMLEWDGPEKGDRLWPVPFSWPSIDEGVGGVIVGAHGGGRKAFGFDEQVVIDRTERQAFPSDHDQHGTASGLTRSSSTWTSRPPPGRAAPRRPRSVIRALASAQAACSSKWSGSYLDRTS
jgi:biopolymer transport protein ExbD